MSVLGGPATSYKIRRFHSEAALLSTTVAVAKKLEAAVQENNGKLCHKTLLSLGGNMLRAYVYHSGSISEHALVGTL